MIQSKIKSFFSKREFILETEADYIGNVLFKTGRFYEIDILEKHFTLFGAPSSIIDVGSNIGNHAIFWAGVFGTFVQAIEPHPKIFALLQKNIDLNSLSKLVETNNIAMGSSLKEASMKIPDSHNLGTSRIISNLDEKIEDNTASVRINVMPLDDFIASKSITSIDLVKIDVEGYEIEVLEGAKNFLHEFQPTVWVEISEGNYQKCKCIFDSLGYKQIGKAYGGSENYFFTKKNIKSFSNIKSTFIRNIDRGKLSWIGNFLSR